MAVNALRIRSLELIDGQIRHIDPNMAIRPSITRELATAICAPLENCEDTIFDVTSHKHFLLARKQMVPGNHCITNGYASSTIQRDVPGGHAFGVSASL